MHAEFAEKEASRRRCLIVRAHRFAKEREGWGTLEYQMESALKERTHVAQCRRD